MSNALKFHQINGLSGAEMLLVDSKEEGSGVEHRADARWVTECLDHGVRARWTSFHKSRLAMAFPVWCDTCLEEFIEDAVLEFEDGEEVPYEEVGLYDTETFSPDEERYEDADEEEEVTV